MNKTTYFPGLLPGVTPPLAGVALSTLAALFPSLSHGENCFNPAFLSADTATVADLSRFEKGNHQPEGVYRVDIWRNDESIGIQDICFTASMGKAGEKSGGLMPCFGLDWMRRFGVSITAFPALNRDPNDICINLPKAIPGSEITFDFSALCLNVSLPQASMLSSARGYIPPEEWGEGIPATLVNYNFIGSRGSDTDSYSLSILSGLNYGPWRLRGNGAWSYSKGDGYHPQSRKDIGIWLQRAIIPLKGELVMGGSNTGNDVFDSVGFRGARLYSSNSMYLDSLQGYVPTVHGTARTAMELTIRQNGYVIYQSYVSPGAFSIIDLNPTSSSGDLEMTVDEKDGDQQRYTVPYFTTPLLQREGRFKYGVVAEDFRSGNSQQPSPFFFQGTLVAGLPEGYTAYGGTQLASRYTAVVLDTGRNLGGWGAVSVDLTHARSQLVDDNTYRGQSLRFLYVKSLNSFGTNFQPLGYRYLTRGFCILDDIAYRSMEGYEYEYDNEGNRHDVSDVKSYHSLSYSKKSRLQINISQNLGDYGSLCASGSQQTYWNTSDTSTWYQVGYASGWQGISYSLSWSWNELVGISDTDRILAFDVSMPFSLLSGRRYSRDNAFDHIYAIFNANRSSNGQNGWQSGIDGTLLDGRNLSYSADQGHSSTNGYSGDANANWQVAYGMLGVGYSYDRDQHDYNWQLFGGVAGHADGITLSQPLGDTNVLVKAPGAQGMRIENQIGVQTDWCEYAVMSYATVYRYNRVVLDTNLMNNNTDVENNASSVVPTQGALVRAAFNTRIGVRALITAKYAGKPVPFRSVAHENTSGVTSMVGEDGQIYLSGLPLRGELLIQWGESASARCVAHYALPEESLRQAVTPTNVTCESSTARQE